MARVFLSYSRKDAEFAGELHRRLQADGVDCFFDTASIEGGEVWPESLGKAIEDCEIFVPILSPDFLASRWGREECHLAMAKGRKIVPLLYRDCQPDGFLQTRQSVDAKDYATILRLLGGAPPAPPLPTDRSVLPPVAPLPARHRMPYRSLGERFVGRVDALWQLHGQLSSRCTSIVFGTGGLGKTQLAVEYVHRFNPCYPGGVFWVEADQGLARLIEVLARAARIEVDGRLKARDQVEAVWAALHGPGAVLVVLDNFRETDPLAPWLPAEGGIHVLVTTRRRDLSGYPHVPLPFLTLEEGVALLNSGDRQFGYEGRPLVQDVGGLPLALELLRGWLEQRRDVDDAALRRRMRAAGEDVKVLQQFAEAYGDELPTAHERNVAATFQLSWDLAPEDGKDVLRAMAYLAPAAVPLRLLGAALGWDQDRLGQSIAALWRLSLVERDAANQPSAHRLILGFVRCLPDGDARWPQAVAAVEKEMARVEDERDTAAYQELEAVVPHAEALLARADLPEARRIEIAGDLGWHHGNLGRHRLAEPLLRNALEVAGRILPAGDPGIARRQSNLALALSYLGQLPEASDLLRQALSSDQHSFPPGDPEIAIKQSNLAAVLMELGELQEARDLLRSALASDQRTFPPGHSEIAIKQSNLALVHQELGELREACGLFRQALDADRKSFPPNHPSIARDQSNLATVLRDLGELPEALDLLRQALAADQHWFPPGHHNIAIDQELLATVLRDLGQLEEAHLLMEQAYDAALERFGPDDSRAMRRRGFLNDWSRQT